MILSNIKRLSCWSSPVEGFSCGKLKMILSNIKRLSCWSSPVEGFSCGKLELTYLVGWVCIY